MRLFIAIKCFLPAVFAGLIGLAAVNMTGCTGEEKPAPHAANSIEGFAFFDVGVATLFSDGLRERLRDSLGADAIERRNIINLEVNWKGFLQNYFPDLHQLNLRLNSPPGERVEHDTVKLMYRYARNKDLPFNYVEMVFSNRSGRPLFIHLYARNDINDIFRTLEDKFGQPMKADLPPGNGRAMYWQDGNGLLLATVTPTRLGDELYRIVIYFSGNIEDFVATEEKERREKEDSLRRTGESAF